MLRADSELTISIKTADSLKTTDSYLIRSPAYDQSTSSSASTTTVGGQTCDVVILPSNRWIILKPQAVVAAGANNAVIETLKNPAKTLDSGIVLSFYAYHSDPLAYKSTKVTYTNPLSNALTPGSALAAATFTASSLETNTKIDLTISISNNFDDAKLVTIKFPAELTPSHLCREAPSSVVEIVTCKVAGQIASIIVNPQASYTGDIDFNIAFSEVLTQATAGAVSDFEVHLYSSESSTHASDVMIIYKVDDVDPSLTLVVATNNVVAPQYLEWIHVPHLSDVLPVGNDRYGPLKFQLTAPVNIDPNMKIEISLDSSLVQDGATNTLNDINDNTLTCFIAEGTNRYTAAVAYDSGSNMITLSDFSAALTSGDTFNFLIQVQTQFIVSGTVKTGLKTASITNTFFIPKVVIKDVTDTAMHAVDLEPYYIQTTDMFELSISKMLTTKINENNIIKFDMEITGDVNMLVFEFPTQHDDGSAMWPTDVVQTHEDDALLPCASALASPLLCISKAGSTGAHARPSTITVTGFTATSNTAFSVILFQILNPAAVDTYAEIIVRAFDGTTHRGTSWLRPAFQAATSANTIATEAAVALYSVTSDQPALKDATYTFKTGVAVAVDNFIIVRLPAQCTYGGSASASSVGTPIKMQLLEEESFIIQPTTALAADDTYTITNIICSQLASVTFSLQHQEGDNSGENVKASYQNQLQIS